MLSSLAACALLLATPALAQQAEAPQQEQWNGKPVFSIEEGQLQHFVPEHVSVNELYHVAESMIGRSFHVREQGMNSTPVANISTLGQNLIVFDTPAHMRRILETLHALDVARKGSAPSMQPLSTMEYRPRYVTLDSITNVLRPFARQVQQVDANGNHWAAHNMSVLEDRALLIVRDTESNLKEIAGLLERVDVPEKQVLLTCYMIRGKEQADSKGLPKELTANLAKLVPQYQFESIGFAMVQTAASPGRTLQLRTEGGEEEVYELEMRPSAFDSETNSLTLERCVVAKHEFQAVEQVVLDGTVTLRPQRVGTTELFSTSTVLYGNDYTVLGATGKEPVFLVIRSIGIER